MVARGLRGLSTAIDPRLGWSSLVFRGNLGGPLGRSLACTLVSSCTRPTTPSCFCVQLDSPWEKEHEKAVLHRRLFSPSFSFSDRVEAALRALAKEITFFSRLFSSFFLWWTTVFFDSLRHTYRHTHSLCVSVCVSLSNFFSHHTRRVGGPRPPNQLQWK